MTVREMLRLLQQVPRDAEVLAFEPGCEEYCEREADEVSFRAAGSPAPWRPARGTTAAVAGQSQGREPE
jgi:hypothetical protein